MVFGGYGDAMICRFQSLILCGFVTLLLGCSSGESTDQKPTIVHPPATAPTTCNPIAEEWDCLYPFPSDHFVVADSTTPTGMRVLIPTVAQPIAQGGSPVNMHKIFPADGFSHTPALQVAMPVRPADSELIGPHDDPTPSVEGTAKTILIDVETGKTVLHFAEIASATGKRQMLAIRPMGPLRPESRHVVAIRQLADDEGKPLEAPNGFATLRDGGLAADHPLAGLSARYDRDIWPVLSAAGVQRDELLLAWDFTTRSEDSLVHDAVTIRNDIVAKMTESNSPSITVQTVTDDVDEFIARRVDATMEVPLYTDTAEAGAVLHRNADGEVTSNGTAEVPFFVLIPRSVMNGDKPSPARVVQFGHGFFGSRDEAAGEYVTSFAHETGMIVVACDWWGMSVPDREMLIEKLVADPETGLNFTQRTHQGFANFLALGMAVKNSLSALPDLQDSTGNPYLATDHLYFYGISAGHILGGVYMALSPHIQQAALSVGGGAFSILIPRAEPFIPFRALLVGAMEGRIDVERYLTLGLAAMDHIDGVAYRRLVFDAPLEGGPTERRVLMHVGIGDTQVPNLGSHAHARALGLPLLQPSPRTLVGFDSVESPHDGSAMVEFDFGIEEPNAIPEGFVEDNGVHGEVRRLPAAIQQLDQFFQPNGTIVHTCDGPCDPE